MKSPTELFREAERFCIENGFREEIEWCRNREPFTSVTKITFLREYAWVIFNSGMKTSVIEAKWNALSRTFLWFDPSEIIIHSNDVRLRALKVFGNRAKVKAVIEMAKKIESTPTFFVALKEQIQLDPLEELEKLHFIGKVTRYHLARNLGFDFIKPDRHLVRLAERYGMAPFELCEIVKKETGEKLGVIDVVFWRYCEQQGQAKLQ